MGSCMTSTLTGRFLFVDDPDLAVKSALPRSQTYAKDTTALSLAATHAEPLLMHLSSPNRQLRESVCFNSSLCGTAGAVVFKWIRAAI